MDEQPRMSAQTLKVLGELMSCSELSGAEISKTTRLPSGTLYPILFRLEKAGWLVSRWEEGAPESLGRPRRRFYKITALGAKLGRQVYEDLKLAMVRLACV